MKNEQELLLEQWRFYARGALVPYQNEEEIDWHCKEETSILYSFCKSVDQGPIKIRGDRYEFSYAIKGNDLIIMFPGTRPRGIGLWHDINCDSDLEMFSTNHFGKQVNIHKGFFERYLELRMELLNVLKSVKHRSRVTFIGHSMGGALAILASIESKSVLKKNSNRDYGSSGNGPSGPQIECFTLAAPMIGDSTFTDLFNESKISITRLVRADDCLPKLAPLRPYVGYGTEIQIDDYSYSWIYLFFIWLALIINYPVSSGITSLGCLLSGGALTHSTSTYINTLDKLKSLDGIKDRKSRNLPERTIGGYSQWYPLILLLSAGYILRLIDTLVRYKNRIAQKIRSLDFVQYYFNNMP